MHCNASKKFKVPLVRKKVNNKSNYSVVDEEYVFRWKDFSRENCIAIFSSAYGESDRCTKKGKTRKKYNPCSRSQRKCRAAIDYLFLKSPGAWDFLFNGAKDPSIREKFIRKNPLDQVLGSFETHNGSYLSSWLVDWYIDPKSPFPQGLRREIITYTEPWRERVVSSYMKEKHSLRLCVDSLESIEELVEKYSLYLDTETLTVLYQLIKSKLHKLRLGTSSRTGVLIFFHDLTWLATHGFSVSKPLMECLNHVVFASDIFIESLKLLLISEKFFNLAIKAISDSVGRSEISLVDCKRILTGLENYPSFTLAFLHYLLENKKVKWTSGLILKGGECRKKNLKKAIFDSSCHALSLLKKERSYSSQDKEQATILYQVVSRFSNELSEQLEIAWKAKGMYLDWNTIRKPKKKNSFLFMDFSTITDDIMKD